MASCTPLVDSVHRSVETVVAEWFGGACRMSRVCEVTGKRTRAGNNVSHAHRKTRRQWLSNLHYHNFWVPSENRFVRLRVSTKGLRLIDKHGIEEVLRRIGKTKGGSGKKKAALTPEKTPES